MASETFETVSVRPGGIIPTAEVSSMVLVKVYTATDTTARSTNAGSYALRSRRRWMAFREDHAIDGHQRI